MLPPLHQVTLFRTLARILNLRYTLVDASTQPYSRMVNRTRLGLTDPAICHISMSAFISDIDLLKHANSPVAGSLHVSGHVYSRSGMQLLARGMPSAAPGPWLWVQVGGRGGGAGAGGTGPGPGL